MPILKHHHESHFAAVPNAVLEDSRLGMKEKGLLAMLISLPEDWDVTVKGLVTKFHLQEGPRAVTTGLRKLQEAGYVKCETVHGSDGKFKNLWYVSDSPVYEEEAPSPAPTPDEPTPVEPVAVEPIAAEPVAAEPVAAEPIAVQGPPTKTEETKTGKETKKEKSASRPFCKPSLGEVRDYCRQRHNHVDAEAFLAHYDSNGWRVGRTPMCNWKAAVLTWEKQDRAYGSRGRGRPDKPEDLPPALHLATNEEGDQVWTL